MRCRFSDGCAVRQFPAVAAILAGLISGVFVTLAQQYRNVPLILHAEEYEGGGDVSQGDPAAGTAEFGAAIFGFASAFTPVRDASAHAPARGAESDMIFGLDRLGGRVASRADCGRRRAIRQL